MPYWRLTALSEKTRTYVGPHGSCDLVLDECRESKIGRAVSGEGSHCLPAHWVQISSNHCRLYFNTEKSCWMVLDSSTNGTFINGTRIIKGVPAAVQPGDCLRLSAIPQNEPESVFEYKLEQLELDQEPAASKVALSHPVQLAKRRHGTSDVSESMPQAHKKARLGQSPQDLPHDGHEASAVGRGDVQAVLQLQKINTELRGKLAEELASREAAQAALKEAEAKAADAVQQALHQADADVAMARSAQQAAEQAQREAVKAAQRVQEQLQQAQQARDQLQADLKLQQAQREALAVRLEEERQAEDNAQAALAAAVEQAAELARQLEAQGQAHAELEARLGEAEGAKQQLEQQAQQLQDELQIANGRVESAEEIQRQLSSRVAELVEEKAAMEQRVAELEGTLGEALSSLRGAQSRLETLGLREQALQEKQVVVRACIHHIKSYAAVSCAAKQELDASYRQVAVAKAKADESYDAMMDQIGVITDHLGEVDSRLAHPKGAERGREGGTEMAFDGPAGSVGGLQLTADCEAAEERVGAGELGAPGDEAWGTPYQGDTQQTQQSCQRAQQGVTPGGLQTRREVPGDEAAGSESQRCGVAQIQQQQHARMQGTVGDGAGVSSAFKAAPLGAATPGQPVLGTAVIEGVSTMQCTLPATLVAPTTQPAAAPASCGRLLIAAEYNNRAAGAGTPEKQWKGQQRSQSHQAMPGDCMEGGRMEVDVHREGCTGIKGPEDNEHAQDCSGIIQITQDKQEGSAGGVAEGGEGDGDATDAEEGDGDGGLKPSLVVEEEDGQGGRDFREGDPRVQPVEQARAGVLEEQEGQRGEVQESFSSGHTSRSSGGRVEKHASDEAGSADENCQLMGNSSADGPGTQERSKGQGVSQQLRSVPESAPQEADLLHGRDTNHQDWMLLDSQ